MNNTEISKFLSFVLRHQPEAIGLPLDQEGWAQIDVLLVQAANTGKIFDRQTLQHIVDTSEKKRFMISEDGLRIRAAQGHSTSSVTISYQKKEPPQWLFHGTATRFLDSIMEKGLLPGSRQYVHLSPDEETATAVGQRHGKPVVLKIQAKLMYEQGFPFYQADNEVWLTHQVPVIFLINRPPN